MTELGWHLMHRLVDDRVFASTPEELRLASRIVLERGRDYDLLSFGFADDHLHTLVVCDRRRAGRFAQVVETALHKRLRLPAPFAPFFPEPIRRQGHLQNTFGYCIRQDQLHRLDRDPFHDGTMLPSLLGLRVLGAWASGRVRRYLPRVDRPALLGLGPRLLGLDADPEPRWDFLREAAAAAAAVESLRGIPPAVVAARRAAVHAGHGPLGTGRLTTLLDIGRSTVCRMLRSPSDPALLCAVELQLRVRSHQNDEGAAA